MLVMKKMGKHKCASVKYDVILFDIFVVGLFIG
jgi:hypothetical protein